MNNFEVIIGLEVHTELKTKTKMFSSAPNIYGEAPNTLANEVDLGYPGSMPSINKKAIEIGLTIAKSLNMKIDDVVWFDRKNYFYPDLPKGFQITQFFRPIGSEGYLDVKLPSGKVKKIGLERIHLEEDTAKQLHLSDFTLLDYNRAGTPLAEIVTKADIHSAEEAVAYLKELRNILIFTNSSDAKMEEGSLRCDVNISLRPKGAEKFGTKVEVKNINSFKNVEKAIAYEIQRQTKLLLRNEPIDMETRRWEDGLGKTILMRKKTGEVDYKYFVEPNIMPVNLEKSWVQNIIKSIPELPADKRTKYEKFGLNDVQIEQLIDIYELMVLFESTIKHTKNYKDVFNWLTSKKIEELKNLNTEYLASMINLIESGELNTNDAKTVFNKVISNNVNPKDLLGEFKARASFSNEQIESIIEKHLTPELVEEHKTRPERVFKFIVGQIMKETRGQANPILVSDLFKKVMDKK